MKTYFWLLALAGVALYALAAGAPGEGTAHVMKDGKTAIARYNQGVFIGYSNNVSVYDTNGNYQGPLYQAL